VPRPAAPGPRLLLTVFALIVAFGGTVYWLSSSYDPQRELAIPVVEGDIAPIPGREPTETATAAQPAPPTQTATTAVPPARPPAAAAAPDQAVAQGETAARAEPAAPPAAPSDEPAPPRTVEAAPATTPRVEPAASAGRPPIALAPAPDPALIRQSEAGPLPIVGPDGRTPLQAYARPFGETGRPRIAIVLGSMGLSRPATIAAIQQLPGPVTLAFAPYGRDLQDYVDQARAAGHEVLLQLPMEPVDYPSHDPGPHTLLTSLPARKNVERLDWLLGRFSGHVGVVNYMGSRFTASEPHLRPVLVAVRDRGLMFVDARSTAASVVLQTANDVGLPAVANDRFIDNEASRRNIDARLQELERLARARGQAIGLAFPYPVTIERLSQWSRGLAARGIDLAPVSALLVKDSLPG